MNDILNALGETEVLCQLAEEAAELSQAALKLRRAIDGKNPTPVSEQDARANLTEETADVLLCLYLLGLDMASAEILDLITGKWQRWAERMESVSEKEGDVG